MNTRCPEPVGRSSPRSGCCREVLSPQLRNYRDIVVALPPGYAAGQDAHPVIYMQDGQNLFDPLTSYAGDWGLVDTLDAEARTGLTPIVVGIPNMGSRRRYEYSPFRDIIHGGGGGDRYLAYLVETVKPLVDASFRTRPERTHTVIAGSSLGGLISLYGLYPLRRCFRRRGSAEPGALVCRRRHAPIRRGAGPLAVGRLHLDIGTEEGAEALMDVRAAQGAAGGGGTRGGTGSLLSRGPAPSTKKPRGEGDFATRCPFSSVSNRPARAGARESSTGSDVHDAAEKLTSMRHEHVGWISPTLGREMPIEVFGHAGARVLVFPTTLGSCYEWGDRHMHEVLADHIDAGWIQLFCLDHVHDESWYNKTCIPAPGHGGTCSTITTSSPRCCRSPGSSTRTRS